MNLLDKFTDLPAYQAFLARVRAGYDTVDSAQGLGLPRAARLPLVARLQQDLRRPIVLISNRADRALTLFEELQFWMGESPVYYLSLIHI